MPKTKEIFICRECGSAQTRWMGKCPDCNAWDSLVAERVDPSAKKDPRRAIVEAWADLSTSPIGSLTPPSAHAAPISDVPKSDSESRLSTGIPELNRVLGGTQSAQGLIPGSIVLIGGAPGIGKSTLLLQAAHAMSARETKVLYVSSEESAQQIALRSQRLTEARDTNPSNLFVLSETSLPRILDETRKVAPAILVIDSIQMLYKPDLPAAPGSVTQLRRCAAELTYLAKLSGIAVILVGHITKDGQLAGPRVLEHLVDAVLSFEGDRYHAHRLVRAIKNRFGATDEIGIFEMTSSGLKEVPEGAGVSALDLTARPGSVVAPVITGTRCVLVELQALTATGFIGAAKRKSSGLDPNRLAMLIAVLEQHAELRLADRDVFASSVGGVRVAEPAADLALLLAIASAHLRRALAPATAAVGEVGLGGEIRPVAQLDSRIREAARLGYTRILIPHAQHKSLASHARSIELVPVKSIAQAIEQLG